MDELQSSPLLAALDLGSNSFHLIVARVEHGEIRPIERIGEKVQLAAGIEKGVLSDAAIERGLECLARFRQVLDSFKPNLVRAVGTNALRAAKNSRAFTESADAILGCPIEIISGREEARLIYLGVAHTRADDQQSRLVVDIGGGSTEFVVGQQFEAKLLESLHMGCVGYMQRFFPNGDINEKRFRKAYEAATLEVLNIRNAYHNLGWQECIGSSGTLLAIELVLQEQGWVTEGITAKALGKLCQKLFGYSHVDELDFPGLPDNRRAVFPSGLAIVCALVDGLGIRRMSTSSGALREGVVYDMLGRLRHEDVRERSVGALMQRYNVDEQTAGRVEIMAGRLCNYVQDRWDLNSDDLLLLRWAARLHEVGLAIAHSQFHRHGEYVIYNSDLPGFSSRDQTALALLVRGHRRKFPVDLFAALPAKQRTQLERICLLLRLAVLFKYVTPLEGEPEFAIDASDHTLQLTFAEDWLNRHPMTAAELLNEAEQLQGTGYTLAIV